MREKKGEKERGRGGRKDKRNEGEKRETRTERRKRKNRRRRIESVSEFGLPHTSFQFLSTNLVG